MDKSKQVKREATVKRSLTRKRISRVFKRSLAKTGDKPDKTIETPLIVPDERVRDKKRRSSFGPSQYLDHRLNITGVR